MRLLPQLSCSGGPGSSLGVWPELLGVSPEGGALTKARPWDGHLPPSVQQEAGALLPAGVAGLAAVRIFRLWRLKWVGADAGPGEARRGPGAGREKSMPASPLQGPRPHAGACPTRAALGRLGQRRQRGGGGHNCGRGGAAEATSLYTPFLGNSLPPHPALDTSYLPLTPSGLKHLPQNSILSPPEHRVPNLGVSSQASSCLAPSPPRRPAALQFHRVGV